MILPGYLRVRFESGFVAGRQVLRPVWLCMCVCVGGRVCSREKGVVETANRGLFNSLRVLSCERSFQIWCKETGAGLPQLILDRQLELGAGTLAAWF